MNIKNLLIEHYNINAIEKIEKTKFGSGNTYIIITPKKKYLLKDNCKKEDINIYNLIKEKETDAIFPNMYQNNEFNYVTENTYVLFEYVDGETFIKFDEEKTLKAINKIKILNKILRNIKVNLNIENDWDRIRDNDYLLNNVIRRIDTMILSKEYKLLIGECIKYLIENRSFLLKEHCQLIHIDLGPDNFIVKDNEIISIIDFTPGYSLELLSLAHFIYWNYFWFDNNYSKEKLKTYLKEYYGEVDIKDKIKEFNISIIIACLYRVLGPLFNMEIHGLIDVSILNKRFSILKWTKNNLLI